MLGCLFRICLFVFFRVCLLLLFVRLYSFMINSLKWWPTIFVFCVVCLTLMWLYYDVCRFSLFNGILFDITPHHGVRQNMWEGQLHSCLL
jgi:hypothetical protein